MPVMIALTLGLPALPANAQRVTFNFDNGTPPLTTYQNLPAQQTAGEVTAWFTTEAGAFSIQTPSSMGGFKLSQFSGKFLAASVDYSVLGIQFSRALTNITLNFATTDFPPIEIPTPIELLAYANSMTTPPVGSTMTRAEYATDTVPMGTLSLSSATPFNWIKIRIAPNQPPGARQFFVDNVTVAAAPPPANTPPVIAAISNQTVFAGHSLDFTISASDADQPPQSLSFSLVPGAPPEAGISSGGQFHWTPAQGASTNLISVRVTDDGSSPLSATNTFTLVVAPEPQPLSISSIVVAAKPLVTLTWDAEVGAVYRLQQNTNLVLAAWSDVGASIIATNTSVSVSIVPGDTDQCFYRVSRVGSP